MSSGFKKEKLSEKIQFAVSEYLRQLSDSRLGLISITRVELSPDMSQAKVYWDTFDTSRKLEVSTSLKNVGGKMRSQLSKVIKIRQVPSISFIYDSQFEDEMKIDQLLSGDND